MLDRGYTPQTICFFFPLLETKEDNVITLTTIYKLDLIIFIVNQNCTADNKQNNVTPTCSFQIDFIDIFN